MDYDEALETVRDVKASINFLIDDIVPINKEMGCGAEDVVDLLCKTLEACMECEGRLENAKAEYEEEKRNEIDEDAAYEAWKDRRAEEE